MSQTFQIRCCDGCGRVLGSVTLPDGVPYPGDAYYGFVDSVEHAPLRAQAATQKLVDAKMADDAALQAAIDARLKLKGLIL